MCILVLLVVGGVTTATYVAAMLCDMTRLPYGVSTVVVSAV